MSRKIIAIIAVFALALCIVGCGESKSKASSASAASMASQKAKSFDGSAFADTGEGEMILKTAGGTSEGGNVPQIAAKKSTSMMQIELDYNGGDGSVCTVYIDGIENQKLNASQRSQNSLTLKGDALSEGMHIVEMVSMDGDTPKIYKKAQYEIVL